MEELADMRLCPGTVVGESGGVLVELGDGDEEVLILRLLARPDDVEAVVLVVVVAVVVVVVDPRGEATHGRDVE